MLPPETTHYLLKHLSPIHVFSGDSHDQCVYHHPGGIVEVSLLWWTVKSFPSTLLEHLVGLKESNIQGYIEPISLTIFSFGMLTLVNGNKPYVKVDLCFLPSQLLIYISYLASLIMSLVLLVPLRGMCGPHGRSRRTYWTIFGRRLRLILCSVLPLYLLLLWIATWTNNFNMIAPNTNWTTTMIVSWNQNYTCRLDNLRTCSLEPLLLSTTITNCSPHLGKLRIIHFWKECDQVTFRSRLSSSSQRYCGISCEQNWLTIFYWKGCFRVARTVRLMGCS